MGINRRQRDRLWQLVQEEWCPLWVRFREATLKAGKKLDDDKQSQASTDGGGVAHYGRRSALHRLTRDSGKVQPGSLFTSEALERLPPQSTLSNELLEALVKDDPNAIQVLLNLHTFMARGTDLAKKAGLLQAVRQFATRNAEKLPKNIYIYIYIKIPMKHV